MTNFKVGDRVKVEFEGKVRTSEIYGERILVSDKFSGTWVLSENVTKIPTPLPTKRGSVIESHGYRFMLTAGGWHASTDEKPWSSLGRAAFEDSMYAEDFTVVLEG